jgi:hypothetical protein
LGVEDLSKLLKELDFNHEQNNKMCIDGIKALELQILRDVLEKDPKAKRYSYVNGIGIIGIIKKT